MKFNIRYFMKKVKKATVSFVCALFMVLIHSYVYSQGEDMKEKAKLHNSEGLIYIKKGDYSRAQKSFTLAYAADKTNSEYPNNIGITYMKLRDLDQAAQYF